jgi:hypothetical protein
VVSEIARTSSSICFGEYLLLPATRWTGSTVASVAPLLAQVRLELRHDVEPHAGHREQRDAAEDERELVL